MQKPDRAVYTPTDFLTWRESKGLTLTPKFQRRGVWKPAARSFFIDTLLRGMPIPPIYIRVTQLPNHKGVVREVIDGQQRLAAVMDFMDGNYRLSKNLNATWAGQTFDQLAPDNQKRLTAYGFSSEVFQDLADMEVLELFSRLNTYSVPLNAQELRNGKFFGLFKQSAYGLALEHLEFWRKHHIFSETSIARMLEVELVSELLIAAIDEMQDKKKSIDSFYDSYDDTFPGRGTLEKHFRVAIDVIAESVETLADTEFRRSPLFYTLWCVVYHRLYGLPKATAATKKKPLDRAERESLRDALASLSERVAAARAEEPVPQRYEAFVTACLQQTDNLRPRQVRFSTLYRAAFE